MKPLQTLDHVMLWVARVFSFLFFAIVFLGLTSTFVTRGISGAGIKLNDFLVLGASGLAAMATWMLNSLLLRLCLGLIGAVFCTLIALDSISVLPDLATNAPPHKLVVLRLALFYSGILLFGFASFIWISLRNRKSV